MYFPARITALTEISLICIIHEERKPVAVPASIGADVSAALDWMLDVFPDVCEAEFWTVRKVSMQPFMPVGAVYEADEMMLSVSRHPVQVAPAYQQPALRYA